MGTERTLSTSSCRSQYGIFLTGQTVYTVHLNTHLSRHAVLMIYEAVRGEKEQHQSSAMEREPWGDEVGQKPGRLVTLILDSV